MKETGVDSDNFFETFVDYFNEEMQDEEFDFIKIEKVK